MTVRDRGFEEGYVGRDCVPDPLWSERLKSEYREGHRLGVDVRARDERRARFAARPLTYGVTTINGEE